VVYIKSLIYKPR